MSEQLINLQMQLDLKYNHKIQDLHFLYVIKNTVSVSV